MNSLHHWLDCRFVRGALSAYIDGEAAAAGARIEAHLTGCAACRGLAHALRLQARAIEAFPAEEDPPAGFVSRVMDRIGAAEAETAPAAPAVRTLRLAPAAALAAVTVVIALAFWVIVSRGPAPVIPPIQPPPTVAQEQERAPKRIAQNTPHLVPAPAPALAGVGKPAPNQPVSGPTAPKAPPAQEYRDLGRSYEDEGQLDDALKEYAAARDRGGSELARVDVARVYEKTGRTADALDELMQVAFAEVDDQRWEPLSVD